MLNAIVSGLAGACAVTLMNETVRQFDEEAPRLDLIGMRGMADLVAPDDLRTKALAADIATNAAYYAIAASAGPDQAPICGATLGLGAGIGAVLLPGKFGYGDDVTNRSTKTRVLSIVYYTTAGLLAGMVYRSLARR